MQRILTFLYLPWLTANTDKKMESNSGLTGHPVRNGCKMVSEKWDKKLSEGSDKLPVKMSTGLPKFLMKNRKNLYW